MCAFDGVQRVGPGQWRKLVLGTVINMTQCHQVFSSLFIDIYVLVCYRQQAQTFEDYLLYISLVPVSVTSAFPAVYGAVTYLPFI